MISWLFRRRREVELDEEIKTHLRMAVEERMARGESRPEAERAVRREFGNVGHVKEATRLVWGGMWLDRLVQDLTFAVRQLKRSPGFAFIAFTTIAVSIGLTLIITSHPVQSAFRMADRFVFLSDGKALSASPEDFKNSDEPAVTEFLEAESDDYVHDDATTQGHGGGSS